ncbi:hypothetical protein CC80DRAFT_547107 [Byssothecium circinans]|uniref:Uncharacterized protein n=1 Tax=Byssothecium circinans TaxID=147558 RepID=A0A6A5U065_9PLEO|nr:hypothetical protein CC80DRAFT_547107 [Byssothecium circinans]
MRASKSLTSLPNLGAPKPAATPPPLPPLAHRKQRSRNRQPHTGTPKAAAHHQPSHIKLPPKLPPQRSSTTPQVQPSTTTNPTHPNRRAHSQAPPSSRTSNPNPNLTLPPAKAQPTLCLDLQPEIPATPEPMRAPTVLTCPACHTPQFQRLAPRRTPREGGADGQTTAICQACLTRFRKCEKREKRNTRSLTSFPSLLAEDSSEGSVDVDAGVDEAGTGQGKGLGGKSMYERVVGVFRGGGGVVRVVGGRWSRSRRVSRRGSESSWGSGRRESLDSVESQESLASKASWDTEGTWYGSSPTMEMELAGW